VPSRPTPTVKFLRFHRENPHVYRDLVVLTRDTRSQLGAQLSIKFVYEGLRWKTYTETTGDPYKLSNSFTSFYARLLMHCNPDLRGVFTLRPSVADEEALLIDADQLDFWPEARRDDGWLEDAARVEDST
jgi:hypothetical protein